MLVEFKKGDAIRFNERGRMGARQPWRVGTYVGQSRDGTCDRVTWPDVKSVRTITKGFIEKVEVAVAADEVMDLEPALPDEKEDESEEEDDDDYFLDDDDYEGEEEEEPVD